MPLADDLLTVFEQMNTDADGEDSTFSEGVMTAIRTSFESGTTVGTIYNGTCSLGVVSATVTGNSITISGADGYDPAEQIVLNACEGMKAAPDGIDLTWIQAIVDGCVALVSPTGTVEELLAGTAIPPTAPFPPTVPVAGPGKGTLIPAAGVPLLMAQLLLIPAAMMAVPGQNAVLATMMAAAVLSFFAACAGVFEGDGPLVGLAGANVMVGNI